METVIIGCRTLERELLAAIEETGCTDPVTWIPSGLHADPRQLRTHLQYLLDELSGADRVLMAMGYCGHAVVGLHTGDFTLVVPRADDCITLLLGSEARRQAIRREGEAYFFTQGWLDGEQNLMVEYDHAVAKYGSRSAQTLYRSLFRHYRRLALIDAGVYPVEAVAEQTARLARTLRLEHTVLGGTLAFLRQLLTGPWPADRFLTVPPGGSISLSDVT